MQQAVDAYHELANDNTICDYSFHVIVTDPSEEQMHVELPKLIEQGITSVKVSSFASSHLHETRQLTRILSRFIRRIPLSSWTTHRFSTVSMPPESTESLSVSQLFASSMFHNLSN